MSPKTLIYPYPADMWGGQRHPAHELRIKHAIEVWDYQYQQNDILADIYCGGGLPNKYGVTIAEDMAQEFTNLKPWITPWLIVGALKSTHTGDQTRDSRDQILARKYDTIIAISNRWHLLGICQLLRNLKMAPVIIGSPAPNWGSWIERMIQIPREILRYFMIRFYDKAFQYPDKFAQKRRDFAKNMLPTYPS